MSRKFRNDYCQLKLASCKYFCKTIGSSNNAEAFKTPAGAESDVYGQPSMNEPHSRGQRVVRVVVWSGSGYS